MSVTQDEYALYLRKSRKDMEAEAHGEGETLARHERVLLALAKAQGLNITKIYREVVSGETLAARPQMQQLLADVDAGLYAGVLVMEIERLARGDTIDQGIVAQAFQLSGTKIITPTKSYDPNNEIDEEYFEFGLFMSRREYKTIKRRMLAGKLATAREGRWITSTPPYGYERVKIKDNKGYTLTPNPEQAEIVRMIFEWFIDGEVSEDGTRRRRGMHAIATRLNELGVAPAKGGLWQYSSVTKIIKNPVYAGKIRYRWRKQKTQRIDGVLKKSYPINKDDIILVEGLHSAIIEPDVFEQAQQQLSKNDIPHVRADKTIANPLAGLIYCSRCGSSMQRRTGTYRNGDEGLSCKHQFCPTSGTRLKLVEDRLLAVLNSWVSRDFTWEQAKSEKAAGDFSIAIKSAEAKQAKLNKQLSRAYELLETDVYTVEEFATRSKAIGEQLSAQSEILKKLISQQEQARRAKEYRKSYIPKIKTLLDVYYTLPTAAEKNALLKEIIDRCEYTKDNRGKSTQDDFDLVVYPKLS
ncbi:MAG: recombinase family protein [Clostridium sp.]|jgi:DNA invertase Pin-like site-specific DNA recombinase|nr:recombinase family protein [Clostridium sp.]